MKFLISIHAVIFGQGDALVVPVYIRLIIITAFEPKKDKVYSLQ